MTRERRIEEIFDAALDVAFEDRSAFLVHACVGDQNLVRELEELFAAQDARTPGPLQPSGLAMITALGELAGSLPGIAITPGMEIDRYQILRLLGHGGMGAVFLARDTRLHRRVAIKLLHAATQEMAELFLAEARATARCKHENIVVVHDVDDHDGIPYMVLEYLEGISLRQHLTSRAMVNETSAALSSDKTRAAGTAARGMPIDEVLALAIPMVRALGCAHAHGIVHRDLKPENIFLCRDGTTKVLDFGIAKVVSDAHDPGPMQTTVDGEVLTMLPRADVLTARNALVGTVPYMAPEQWRRGTIDARTDLWAVGVMLHEMLAGSHPLAPLSHARIKEQVSDLDTPMPGIDAAVPGLGALADVVDRCLRKRADERMPDAPALLEALEAVQTGLPAGVVAPASGATHAEPAVPRRRVRLAFTTLGLGLLALVLLAFWPRVVISPLPEGSGGIVLTMGRGADEALARIHDQLCASLRDRDVQTIRCVVLPRFGIDEAALVEAAAVAGASLLAQLEEDRALHLQPLGNTTAFLHRLPSIQVANEDTQQHLAGVLYPLSRLLAEDRRFEVLRAPRVESDRLGWRLATLAWYLNVLARNQQAIPPADLRGAMARCRQEVSVSDTFCALAHYVHARLEPMPRDARHWLEMLVARGPAAFADMALIALAEDDCVNDPARARDTLLRAAADWAQSPCQRVTLIGPAACLLTRNPGAGKDVHSIAYPREDRLGECEGEVVAAALAERGTWNMRARDWQQATQDFEAAWKQGSHPADLLSWTVSLLQQRDSGINVATPIASELDLRYFEADLHLRRRAAFLRWLATRDPADAAQLLRFYRSSPGSAPAVTDEDGMLASLACEEIETPESIACRVYGILIRPKQPDSGAALQRLLVPGAED